MVVTSTKYLMFFLRLIKMKNVLKTKDYFFVHSLIRYHRKRLMLAGIKEN